MQKKKQKKNKNSCIISIYLSKLLQFNILRFIWNAAEVVLCLKDNNKLLNLYKYQTYQVEEVTA